VPRDLARFIDHTLLRPDATAADVDRLCEEAREFGFAAVCVNPTWVRRCAQNLRGSSVRVASVVGFPFGAGTTEVKALEARRAIRDGAREIDMVIRWALKSGDYDLVRRDIERIRTPAAGSRWLKVIIGPLLTDGEGRGSHLAKVAKPTSWRRRGSAGRSDRAGRPADGRRSATRDQGVGGIRYRGRSRDDRSRHPDRRLGQRADRDRR
jgi:deoxyribose-phosphate aldolase